MAYHGLYKGALRELILRFKFGGDLALVRLLGAWLENAASCLPAPDALAGMPQHPAHLRRRGFNQAHELARALHAATRIPLRTDLLFRKHDSAPQASLNAQERHKNVRGVFGADASVAGLRLWLIDDVVTTGSTLREATRTLLEAGAAEVCVLAVARTPRTTA
ncbi:ComF family protein [Desulfovibrio sp.]|uniref:ComF family protein n=1 Tax=Desulfovibrio sp. TaxID=885 RepID=UPI0025C4CFCB|nr:ComF family protein [Desulfovibrio sp.]